MAKAETVDSKPPKPVSVPQVPSSANPPPKEDKAHKFRRLANARVNAACKRIGHVANLANRNSYTFTEEEAVAVVNAIREAVKRLEIAFSGATKQKTMFDLFSAVNY